MLKAWETVESTSPSTSDNQAAGFVPYMSRWIDSSHDTEWTFHGDSSGGNGKWIRDNGMLYAQETVKAGDTVTGTTSLTEFASNVVIPANLDTDGQWVDRGTELRVYAAGVYTGSGSGNTPTLGVAVEGSTVASTGAINPGDSLTNAGWFAAISIVGTNTVDGTNGAQGIVLSGTISLNNVVRPLTALTTYDSTVARRLAMFAQPSGTGQSFTMRNFLVIHHHPSVAGS